MQKTWRAWLYLTPEYAQDYYDFLIREGALETTIEPDGNNNNMNNEHLEAPYVSVSNTEKESKGENALPIGGKKKAMWKEKERRRKQKKQLRT